ncbi:MAG: hypothetical protein ACYDBV_13170 [Nitrospiria bacterium]
MENQIKDLMAEDWKVLEQIEIWQKKHLDLVAEIQKLRQQQPTKLEK